MSRETLQAHASLKVIKKKIVRKVLDSLKRMSDAEKEAADTGTPLHTAPHHRSEVTTALVFALYHCSEPTKSLVLTSATMATIVSNCDAQGSSQGQRAYAAAQGIGVPAKCGIAVVRQQSAGTR